MKKLLKCRMVMILSAYVNRKLRGPLDMFGSFELPLAVRTIIIEALYPRISSVGHLRHWCLGVIWTK